MSTPQRKAELRREFEAKQEAEERERMRLAARSWYEKIEEASSVEDLKEVLHAMATKLEMEY